MKKRIWIKRRDSVRQRYWKNLSFMPKGVYSRHEIQPVLKPREGRKAKLMRELEAIDENLKVADISEERRQFLLQQKDDIEQQLKRITGSPPVLLVKGKDFSEITKGLQERFLDTSGRRPEFVEDLGLELRNPYGIRVGTADKAKMRRLSREAANIQRALAIISEKGFEEAALGRVKVLKLEDVKRGTRGRRVNLGAWATKTNYPIFDYPESYGHTAKRISIPAKDVMDIVLQTPSYSRMSKEDFLRSMEINRGDQSVPLPSGKYDWAGLDKALKSKKPLVAPVTIDLENNRPIIFEGRHTVAHIYKRNPEERIPVIILKKGNPNRREWTDTAGKKHSEL